jgi:predicted component of type VI protein secretion system
MRDAQSQRRVARATFAVGMRNIAFQLRSAAQWLKMQADTLYDSGIAPLSRHEMQGAQRVTVEIASPAEVAPSVGNHLPVWQVSSAAIESATLDVDGLIQGC